MAKEKDLFPRLSYDLLQQLDKEIPQPYWPTTLQGAGGLDDEMVRKNIWLSAQRYLVESLISQLEEYEQEQENDDEDDPTFWSGQDGPRVLPAALDIHPGTIEDPE